jgi:hypothetical protein
MSNFLPWAELGLRKAGTRNKGLSSLPVFQVRQNTVHQRPNQAIPYLSQSVIDHISRRQRPPLVVKVVIRIPSADWVPDFDHLEPPIKLERSRIFGQRTKVEWRHNLHRCEQSKSYAGSRAIDCSNLKLDRDDEVARVAFARLSCAIGKTVEFPPADNSWHPACC